MSANYHLHPIQAVQHVTVWATRFLKSRHMVAEILRDCQTKYCTETSPAYEGLIVHLAVGHMPECTRIGSMPDRNRQQYYCTFNVIGALWLLWENTVQYQPALNCSDLTITSACLRVAVLCTCLIVKCNTVQYNGGNTESASPRRF